MSLVAVEVEGGNSIDFPKVKGGKEGLFSLPSRVSLIVDLGTQSRQPFEEEFKKGDDKHEKALSRDKFTATLVEVGGRTMIRIPQTPVRQVAIFADLVTERLNYGEVIGEKPARILLNKSFKGEISGVPLTLTQSRDKDGKTIKDSPKTFHSRSLISKLGKACLVDFPKNGNDIRKLAGLAFSASVENKKAKNGDEVYTNYKDCSPVMEGYEVAELDEPCQLITFEDATKDQIKFLWKNVLKMIKSSPDYDGSQIEKAVKEWEAEKAATPTNTSSSSSSVAESEGGEDDDTPF